MKKSMIKKDRLVLIALVIWLAIDGATKVWASTHDMGRWVFWNDFFYLTVHQNQGVAFGITFGQWPQIAISSLILGVLVYVASQMLRRPETNSFLNQVLFGIIFGGAIGNLANRIWLGYVIDFIYLKPFPVFNVADMGITLGLIVLVLTNYRKQI
jgi:signal peptidase II